MCPTGGLAHDFSGFTSSSVKKDGLSLSHSCLEGLELARLQDWRSSMEQMAKTRPLGRLVLVGTGVAL